MLLQSGCKGNYIVPEPPSNFIFFFKKVFNDKKDAATIPQNSTKQGVFIAITGILLSCIARLTAPTVFAQPRLGHTYP
jgi:hypothetical protein